MRQKIAQLQTAIAQDLQEIKRLESLQKTAQAMQDDSLQRLATNTSEKVAKQQAISALNADIAGLEAVKTSLERANIRPQNPVTKRDQEVGGIPVDADHILFIVDTSGSMRAVWGKVEQTMANILKSHPQVTGFQILNDNGTPLLGGYKRSWIKDNQAMRRNVMRSFKNWQSFSNSSPEEGLEVAFRNYVKSDGKRIAIYILGDDFSGQNYDSLLDKIDRLNKNKKSYPAGWNSQARIHAIGFVTPTSTEEFTIFARELTRRNLGSLVLLPDAQKFDPMIGIQPNLERSQSIKF